MSNISLPRTARSAPPAALTAAATREPNPHAIVVLQALRRSGVLTLTELAERTSLSRPTVGSAVEHLVERGWVAAEEPGARPNAKAGRPARSFRFRSEAAIVAGVDVGLHRVMALVADLDGRILLQRQVDLRPGLSGADRVDAVVDLVTATTALLPVPSQLLAVAVGAPGVIDLNGRILVCPPMREWDGIDLGSQLSARLACPVYVENDAMSAAVGENRRGAGRGTKDFVYLLAGHRISSASVINGRLHRGFTGAAGMIGELGALRWEAAPGHLLRHTPETSNPEETSAAHTFRQASAGDAEAIAAVDAYIDDLAFGLAAVVLAVDPELVVVGGGVSLAGPSVATTLREKLAHHAHLVNPRVETSTLGNRAAAIGGLCIALDHVEQLIFATV